KTIFVTVCLKFNSELIEFDGEDDRVHPVILYPPQLAGSPLVFKLKVTSSMLIRKRKYPAVRAKLWGKALRSSSYFTSSCKGALISIIRQYIEQQKTSN
ncbi:IS200/IS605 family transposase, partial [Succinatimonas hippei]|uniref:IS200/IS605 family transposase n=1 Tax=Succinatimonas hippei TaxID=626938 RepID=UPI00255C928E